MPFLILTLSLQHESSTIICYRNMIRDFRKLSDFVIKHKIKLDANAWRKLSAILMGKEKPTKETLDKLALLAGFQSWESLKRTFEE